MLQLLVVVLLQLALNVPCCLVDGFVQVCVLRLPLADDALVRDLDDDLDGVGVSVFFLGVDDDFRVDDAVEKLTEFRTGLVHVLLDRVGRLGILRVDADRHGFPRFLAVQ